MSSDIDTVLGFVAAGYGMQHKEKGDSPRGVLWANEKSQTRRFEHFIELLHPILPEKGASVNDLGCGYGAFFDYLKETPFMHEGQFYGYDICPEMIESANRRITDPRCKFFINHRPTEIADFSFASGTFNFKGNCTDADWEKVIQSSLKTLCSKTRDALAFNMLDKSFDPIDEWLYSTDAEALVEYCKSEFPGTVTYERDAELNSFTVVIRLK